MPFQAAFFSQVNGNDFGALSWLFPCQWHLTWSQTLYLTLSCRSNQINRWGWNWKWVVCTAGGVPCGECAAVGNSLRSVPGPSPKTLQRSKMQFQDIPYGGSDRWSRCWLGAVSQQGGRTFKETLSGDNVSIYSWAHISASIVDWFTLEVAPEWLELYPLPLPPTSNRRFDWKTRV